MKAFPELGEELKRAGVDLPEHLVSLLSEEHKEALALVVTDEEPDQVQRALRLLSVMAAYRGERVLYTAPTLDRSEPLVKVQDNRRAVARVMAETFWEKGLGAKLK